MPVVTLKAPSAPLLPTRPMPREVSAPRQPAGAFLRLTRIGGWTGVAVGVMVLVGWLSNVDWLTSLIPGLPGIKPNIAVCFAVLGAALLSVRSPRASRWIYAACGVVIVVSLATLAQDVFRVDLGIDQFLFRDTASSAETGHPGRMSPQSSLCFALLATGLVLTRVGRSLWLASGLSIAAMLVAGLSALDFVYYAEPPTFLANYTQMGGNTSVVLIMVSVGVLAARSDGGPLRTFAGNRTLSTVSRRLLLAALLIPITIGWLRLEGQQAGLYGTNYGLALTTLVTITLLAGVVWYASNQIGLALAARDEAEERLRSLAVELERSNAELQKFASVASHDLQEPLRKVLNFSQRLETQFAEVLGATGLSYVQRMATASKRMQSLINDLLDYSRVSTKARQAVSVDLARVMDGVLVDLESRIEETGAVIDVGPLPTLDADPLDMRQVFQNLVGNAIKYRRPDVTPRVEVRAEFGASRASAGAHGAWRISVTDNGIGFDEKYVDKVFAPFQRLHSRSEYEGTGIGLAICKSIVERQGGTITATSQPGTGSTFVVTLPAKRPSAVEAPS